VTVRRHIVQGITNAFSVLLIFGSCGLFPFGIASHPERRQTWTLFLTTWIDQICSARQRQWWICCFGVLLIIIVGGLLGNYVADANELFFLFLQGVAAGLLLFIGQHDPALSPLVFAPLITSVWTERRWAYPLVLFLAAAARGWDGLWFGVCLFAIGVILMNPAKFRGRLESPRQRFVVK
jgi:hypothetical protein